MQKFVSGVDKYDKNKIRGVIFFLSNTYSELS